METFSALLAICAENSPVPVNSSHKGQWRGALMFSLICVWINNWVNNGEAGDLRRYRIHYDVTVMNSFWLFPMWFVHGAPCQCYNCWTGAHPFTLRWRHNDHDSVSNHQSHGCLLNRLFRRRSKKTSKLRVTGLCVGNSPGTGEFPAQMASYAENVSIWWRHHVMNANQFKIGARIFQLRISYCQMTDSDIQSSFHDLTRRTWY